LDPLLLIHTCAERVAPQIGVMAWIVDDNGIPGRSPPRGHARGAPPPSRAAPSTITADSSSNTRITIFAPDARHDVPFRLGLAPF
jgi:hypothetical protein